MEEEEQDIFDGFDEIEWINGVTKLNKSIMDEFQGNIKAAFQNVLLAAHPIGSYYWSSESTDPSTLFGGTWTQVKDKFILALGDTYTTAGATGGSASKTIAKTNLPNYNLVAPLKKAAGPTGSGWEWLSPSGNANNVNIPSGGSGTPLDIMPPYEVAYCWKRTKIIAFKIIKCYN